MSEFQTTSKVTARKQHKCCECQGVIQPGQQYERCAGQWDGHMDVYRTCSGCADIRDWATTQQEWSGDGEHLFYFEQLENDLANMAIEIPVGSGRRFKAYRFQIQMVRRRAETYSNSQQAKS